jgi:PD-(D/E)XK nuclease superfamily
VKIDATRYAMFWANPERYRLRECWKLQPVEPTPGTFASLLTYGRRRGTCFHELLDDAYRGVSEEQAVQDLKADGFGEKEITAAQKMAAKVREVYPDEKYLAHERLFEYPIPGSEHRMVGRIDHIMECDGDVIIGDWKSTKKRTKKEMQQKADEYCRSVQVPFYLLGATTLGFDARRFIYRLVVDDPDGVEISEYSTSRTGLELKTFAEGVDKTCDLITWMRDQYGIERTWPQVPERFGTDYAPLIGRRMYKDVIPDGYEPKREHLSLMEDSDAV